MITTYAINPTLANDVLNDLFAASWRDHARRDFTPILRHSLLYVGAFNADRLVGFVNAAWNGGIHGFLLDTTVHPDVQRQGVGRELVRHAADAARERGIVWLHVDFEPHLEDFYRGCGFAPTEAGLLRLRE